MQNLCKIELENNMCDVYNFKMKNKTIISQNAYDVTDLGALLFKYSLIAPLKIYIKRQYGSN